MTNEALFKAAEAIADENLKAGALSLLSKMTESIEGIGDREISWRPSILKVVQSMTDTDKLPDGAKAGDMIVGDSVLAKEYNVIPLRVWDSRLMWHPDKDVNEIICQSPDAKVGYKYGECRKCDHAEFKEGGAACNKTKNVMVVSADLSEVFICVFSKSQFANGKDWEGVMRKAKTHPYKRVYKLSTDSHAKYKKVKVLNASVQTDTLPEDVLSFLEILFNQVSKDRADMIDRFYESIKNRESRIALEDVSGRSETKALEVKEGEVIEGEDEGQQYTI